MFTHRLTVFVTANDDGTREFWARVFSRVLANICGGFTRTDTQGGWVDDNGTLVVETSIKIEALLSADLLAQAELEVQLQIEKYIGDAEQDAALYTVEEVKGTLIFRSDFDLLDDGNQIN